MMDKFKVPSWSTRNPLGIIALFISLIYGMSALLLSASIDSLAIYNQTILVIFMVIFPCAVLGVFVWLVTNHHTKLYGPGDYRTDQSFLSANIIDNPASLGERLGREIEEQDAGEPEIDQIDRDQETPRTESDGPPSTQAEEINRDIRNRRHHGRPRARRARPLVPHDAWPRLVEREHRAGRLRRQRTGHRPHRRCGRPAASVGLRP